MERWFCWSFGALGAGHAGNQILGWLKFIMSSKTWTSRFWGLGQKQTEKLG